MSTDTIYSPVKAIVQTITSTRDLNGNCYHIAVIYNPAKGRNAFVRLEVGGESNAAHLAYTLAGNDWEGVVSLQTLLPKRQWQALRKQSAWLYEGSQQAKQALADLFN